MQKLTLKFQQFKKQINSQIVSIYRECKEIVGAAERGDSDIPDETHSTNCEEKENKLKREQQFKQKTRGRPRMTSSEKERRRLARERGEAIQIKGYIGKDYEQVFDDSGKAIGKKDADGNFIPYKARGRPTVKEVKARNLQEKKTSQA